MNQNQNLLDLIGNTPLVRAQKLIKKEEVSLFFKLEGQNPGGSVKDRPAYNMIRSAIQRGEISQDTRLIEATSGNTGIALAMVARLLNLEIELVMPENSTVERVQTMRAYGAKVILTAADGGIEGARDYAEERTKRGDYFMLNQFGNKDNWRAHYKTTGPEIWKDTDQTLTHFVSSMGTTGTIMGVSTFLKEKKSDIQIVGVQPSEGARIPGIRKWSEAYLPQIFQPEKVDQVMEVSEQEASEMTRRLAEEEGIFAGMSSGGAAAAAVRLCQELKKGVVVSVICDRGDRYLSSDLFNK